MAQTLQELLKKMIASKASDLHIGAGTPPLLRVDGSLRPLTEEILTPDRSQELCYEILSQEQIMKFENDLELDLSFAVEDYGRFRANIFWQQQTIVGAFRHIPFEAPSFEALGLPPLVQELAYRPHGLVIVSGATGSGKSTTLAAMINAMNAVKPWHIITIEDPIEFVFKSQQCLIHQREVGKDTASFQNGLKYVLREDPDVVMVGEMRDLETIRAAITIAETGHLVLTTLHTNTAVDTVDRMIDVFPAHQQPQVRTQLSFILQGILSQQLIPRIGGGRSLALEIMIPSMAIRNLIRESKTHQIYAQMQVGQEESHMLTMNQALLKLVRDNLIEKKEALDHSPDPEELSKMLKK